jgi:hypothetical protein
LVACISLFSCTHASFIAALHQLAMALEKCPILAFLAGLASGVWLHHHGLAEVMNQETNQLKLASTQPGYERSRQPNRLLTSFDFESYETCEACLLGKMTKMPF